MKERKFSTYQIVFVAVMAALVCVVTFFRFPLLGSKVHFANAMCLLSGMLFGPMLGGLAAGLGSMLYDALFGGYDFINCLVTFVSKFLMAAICAWIAFGGKEEGKGKHARLVVGSVVGALSYVALYMLKTYIFQRFVHGYPLDAVVVTMGGKLPASLINAVFAMIVAPILYAAIAPALRRKGMLEAAQVINRYRKAADPKGSAACALFGSVTPDREPRLAADGAGEKRQGPVSACHIGNRVGRKRLEGRDRVGKHVAVHVRERDRVARLELGKGCKMAAVIVSRR